MSEHVRVQTKGLTEADLSHLIDALAAVDGVSEVKRRYRGLDSAIGSIQASADTQTVATIVVAIASAGETLGVTEFTKPVFAAIGKVVAARIEAHSLRRSYERVSAKITGPDGKTTKILPGERS